MRLGLLDIFRRHKPRSVAAESDKSDESSFQNETERRLHVKVLERLVDKTRKKKSIDYIVLKFPRFNKAFEKINKVFRKYDKGNKHEIDCSELHKCFSDLHVQLTAEEVDELYREAGLDNHKGVTFREFIIAMTFAYLLAPGKDQSSRFTQPEVEQAFEFLVDAFLVFDRDGHGWVTKEEVLRVLSEGHGHGKGEHKDTSGAARFEEMDFNTDGKISFAEFLYAFVGWVRTAGGTDDPDED